MKKKTAFIMVLLTGLAGVTATVIWAVDLIPALYYEALLVVDFPLFVLSTGLWWMARERESDIPFVGY